MKKLLFTTMFLLLCAVFALSQTSSTNPSTSSSTSQSGTGTSSTSGQTGSQSGTTTPSTTDQTSPSSSSSSTSQDTGSMGSSKSQSASNGKGAKGEKKIEGCLESAGSSGQYVVRHKNKEVAVIPEGSASSDLSSNVGHKVKVYGTWEQGSGTQTAMNSSGSSSSTLPQSDQPGKAGSTAGAGSGSSSSEMGGTTSGAKTDAGKNAKEFRASRVESVSDTCDASKGSSKK
jgi:hypothetical protein